MARGTASAAARFGSVQLYGVNKLGIPLVALQSNAPQLGNVFALRQQMAEDKARQQSLQAGQQGLAQGQQNLQIGQQNIAEGNIKLDAYQAAQQRESAVQNAIQQAGGIKEALPEIMKIDPDTGFKYQKELDAWDKAGTDKKISTLDLHQKKLERMSQIAGGITDEPSMRMAADTMKNEGLIDDNQYSIYSQMPYDPQVVKSFQQQAMTTKEQLDQQKQDLASKKEIDQAAETKRHNIAMENPASIKEYDLAKSQGYKGTFSDWQQHAANLRKAASSASGGVDTNDAGAIADAIISGDQPPLLTGLYRMAGPVRASLAKKGFDLSTATRDWTAIQRHLSTLNGAQQERLRQAISTASDSLDVLDDLYKQWQQVGPASGFKVFNRAALAAAKQVPGQTGAVAQALETQIADLTSELGTVYKGGNGSTDESLGLAAKNLSGDWNQETWDKAMKLAHTNVRIRKNSILNSAPVGVSANSPYTPPAAGEAAEEIELERGPDGKLRVKK